MSGDPEQEYFADGMVEEIITALSWIRWLSVIAPIGTFIWTKAKRSTEASRANLGVHYVLEVGRSIAGERVLELMSSKSMPKPMSHLRPVRFDGSLYDVLDLQDKAASSVPASSSPPWPRGRDPKIEPPPDP